jgi:hypothetical protein
MGLALKQQRLGSNGVTLGNGKLRQSTDGRAAFWHKLGSASISIGSIGETSLLAKQLGTLPPHTNLIGAVGHKRMRLFPTAYGGQRANAERTTASTDAALGVNIVKHGQRLIGTPKLDQYGGASLAKRSKVRLCLKPRIKVAQRGGIFIPAQQIIDQALAALAGNMRKNVRLKGSKEVGGLGHVFPKRIACVGGWL